MKLKLWGQCFKLFVKRTRSTEDYVAFQKFQAEQIVHKAQQVFDLPRSATVLDYGCGGGGYSVIFARYFHDVVGVDLFQAPLSQNIGLPHLRFEKADLLTYRTEPRDFVFCASVIEHIPKHQQAQFITNLILNLKKTGWLYLSFPPFYSPIGGHICAPFHYLPDRWAFFLTDKLKHRTITSYETMFAYMGEMGLYKTFIGEIEQLLLAQQLAILKIGVRYMPLWYETLFKRNNVFNWHVEFWVKKL